MGVAIGQWVGSKGFSFWRKTDEMMKTGSHDKSIDFWLNFYEIY